MVVISNGEVSTVHVEETSPFGATNKKKKLENQVQHVVASNSVTLPTVLDDEYKKQQQQQPRTKKHTDPKVLKVRHAIQACCKSNDLPSALLIYKEAQSCSVWIEPQTYACLLALCDGLDARGLHIGTPRPTSSSGQQQQQQQEKMSSITATSEERKDYAFEIKQTMDKHKISFSETAYTSLVRVLCKAKESALAEEILTEAESAPHIKLKLRMYSAVIQTLSEEGQLDRILSLWKRMIQRDIVLTEREYARVLKCAVNVGNAAVVNRVLADLAEDVLVPSHETTRTIIDWFSSTFASIVSSSTTVAAQSSSSPNEQADVIVTNNVAHVLGETTAPSIGPVVSTAGWTISTGCRVDATSGMLLGGCLSNCFLKPVELSPMDRLEMMRMNEAIVMNDGLPTDTSNYAGGGKGKKRKTTDANKRTQMWDSFKYWLERHVGTPVPILNSYNNNINGSSNTSVVARPYEVVIDGANIGYYKQNYANAPKHVDYNQIDWVVQHFQRDNKRVLLVLHERHFSPKLMPEWAIPILNRWEGSESEGLSLFRAPHDCNDDWFWLHAALLCGKECMVVTNDEMRDHHFQMLAYRSFLRWKERHQIRFNFGDWITTPIGGRDHRPIYHRHRKVKAYYPDVYSRRIQSLEQGIVIPLPKKGDEDRFLDGNFVSENDPEEETYVCIARKVSI